MGNKVQNKQVVNPPPSGRELDKVKVANEIRARLQNFVKHSQYSFNPDVSVVETIIKGLTIRMIRTGYAYCPCRVVTGNIEKDAKIICPCIYHEEEIRIHGICHCGLFVGKDYTCLLST
ncbi:MAG TPA: ferredoxin-thioredoxin reductase catalytic domain-containing protein [Candidatus Brocadiia bacterium]|nr:ferredoxin:thioredoxin reductase [Planctomycetota bacterium]